MKTKKISTAIAAAALAIGMAACTTEGEPSKTKTVTETSSPSSTSKWPTEDAEAEVTPEVDPESGTEMDNQIGDFGDTYDWDDGVSATVSAPEAYTPDQYAFGGEGYTNKVKFTVSITNNSSTALDATFVTPTVTSGTRQGEEIYDDNSGYLESSVLPGRTASFDVAFGVDDPEDIVVEFAPSWDHSMAYWQTGGAQG